MRHYFWGIFLIAAGAFLLLKHYLNLNVPTGRILFGLFIVSVGVSILIGGFTVSRDGTFIFSDGRIDGTEVGRDHNVIFSRGVVDLTNLSADRRKVEINTIFGTTDLVIPANRRVTIRSSAAFGTAEMPDGGRVHFGELIYRQNAEESDLPELVIELNTVFGSTSVRKR